ncbi:MAG: signal peptidase [Verrucomicrobiales bacterium]|nr:signal peptidase [Verrucomicrobiales bacterium]
MDILSPEAIAAVKVSLKDLETAMDSNASNETINGRVEELERTANSRLKPFPNPEWRENIEVFLVAIAVAMAIRTFFLQPFKIPTGSMQPTLYGVTVKNLKDEPNSKVPGAWGRFVDVAAYGTYYHELIAEQDGTVEWIGPAAKTAKFINKREVKLSYRAKPYTIWCTPDEDGSHRFEQYSGLQVGQSFQKGEPVWRFKEVTGDHLFVDRMTYNFRHPQRGEIIVFATKGIHYDRNAFREDMPQDQFYIKRLIGLGGETISSGADRHIRINGLRLDASTPRFENLYSFTNSVGADSQYSGHTPVGYLDYNEEMKGFQSYVIHPKHFFAMGDNTVNSSDSRYWGELPEDNVIGKPCFIYWPISPRFGWGYR